MAPLSAAKHRTLCGWHGREYHLVPLSSGTVGRGGREEPILLVRRCVTLRNMSGHASRVAALW